MAIAFFPKRAGGQASGQPVINPNSTLRNGLVFWSSARMTGESLSMRDAVKNRVGAPTGTVSRKGESRFGTGVGTDGVSGLEDFAHLAATDGLSQMTISLWMRLDATANALKAYVTQYDSVAATGWILESGWTGTVGDDRGFIFAVTATGNDYINTVQATGPIVVGVPFNVVCVYDGTQAAGSRANIYFNGVSQSVLNSGTIPATAPTVAHALRLSATNNGIRFSNATFFSLRIWNRPLSIAEIGLEYTNPDDLVLTERPQYYIVPVVVAGGGDGLSHGMLQAMTGITF